MMFPIRLQKLPFARRWPSPAGQAEGLGDALDHGRLAIAQATLGPLLVDNGEVGAQASRLADQVDLFMGRRRAISRDLEISMRSLKLSGC